MNLYTFNWTQLAAFMLDIAFYRCSILTSRSLAGMISSLETLLQQNSINVARVRKPQSAFIKFFLFPAKLSMMDTRDNELIQFLVVCVCRI